MVESMIRGQQIKDTPGGPTLGIVCGKHNPADTGMHNGTGTHGTGLKRDIQGGSRQPIVTYPGGGIPQRHDLRVGGRVLQCNGPVPAFADNLAFQYDHSTYRHFALGFSPLRQQQCLPHELLILQVRIIDNHQSNLLPSCLIYPHSTANKLGK